MIGEKGKNTLRAVSRQNSHLGSVEKIKKIASAVPSPFEGDPAYHLKTLKRVPGMAAIIWEIKRALEEGVAPEKVPGANDVYIMKDRNKAKLAIFKPTRSLREGESMKEVASYLLDHENFAGTPPIVIAAFSHPLFGENRQGTCQLYMEEGVRAVDVLFLPQHKGFSARAVRKMMQLDIRLLNFDRHTSNMLVSEESDLIPIDHQLVLSEIYGGVYFQWMVWPQAKTPFSKEEKRYIANIDAKKDYLLLKRELGLKKGSCDLCFIATELLQECVKQDFTGYEIASLFVPESQKDPAAWRKTPFYNAYTTMSHDSETDWEGFEKSVKSAIKGILCV